MNLSSVFTWDIQEVYSRAVWWREMGWNVQVGGPGVFLFRRRFDGVATIGQDIPDAVTHHNPAATFASRGCPVGCSFCIVPKMEGREFTLLPDFEPRPILCDNNLSALPGEYQDYIVEKYQRVGVLLLDANSGFEPATFDETVRDRWAPVLKGPWRYAFDEMGEAADVERVCRMLAGYRPNQKRVYVLIGNEPFDSCLERIRKVIEWGAEPHVQPVMKLVAQDRKPWVRYDWCTLCRAKQPHKKCSDRLLRDVARWANRFLWRKRPFSEYRAHKGARHG